MKIDSLRNFHAWHKTIDKPLDNGPLHKAKKLQLPPNIVLLFQPSHSPELNPIERLWEHLKGQLKWQVFKDLKHLQSRVSELLKNLEPEVITSLTGWTYILDALSVADISWNGKVNKGWQEQLHSW